MNSQNATAAAQDTRNIKHDPIPLEFIGLFLIFLLMAFRLLNVGVGACIIVAGYMYIRHVKAVEALKEAKARAGAWANLIGPVVVGSAHPGESAAEVAERAVYYREQLRLSGNPWAEKLPIIEMPYTPILTAYGQLTAGWSIYQKSVGERQHIENMAWYERGCPNELKAMFANSVLPQLNQEQQPQ